MIPSRSVAHSRQLWAVAIPHHSVINNSLNARLVRAGLAYAAFWNDYQDAERAAHSARAGVWQQRGGGERPRNYRRLHRQRRQTPVGCFSTLPPALLLLIVIAAASG